MPPPLLRAIQVKWVDPDTKEEIDTGLVRTRTRNQAQGGGSIDVGGGNAFGGASADEGADDAEETKLDQFWNFPAIEVRFHSFFYVNFVPPFHTHEYQALSLICFAIPYIERGQVRELCRVQEGLFHAVPANIPGERDAHSG